MQRLSCLRAVVTLAPLLMPGLLRAAASDDTSLVASIDALATKNGLTVGKPPAWARGAFVYRVSTPDEAKLLPTLEAGLAATANLLDGSVRQVVIANGLIGHDHPGQWNWDGLWPYWGRVTFRAGDWAALSECMTRMKQRSKVELSFHLNLTDVNVGLRDYPDAQRFFARLVETKSIYRRDHDDKTGRRDRDPPYVPTGIPTATDAEGKDVAGIFALVNYQRFWDSGLAREMIDGFYQHLPYAPPILYLDVLNLSGGNFSTGFPDGPLGGSEQSQLAGVLAIADHVRSKGTDLATEGIREMLGPRATYVWLHGRGWSRDDYSVIDGGHQQSLAWQHVVGNMGAFNLSPVAVTAAGVTRAREHATALASGKSSPRRVAGSDTYHLAFGEGVGKEYDIPGTGDPFRGDWYDLLGNFYLTGIQELHHIGKGNARVATFNKLGALHLTRMTITGDDGVETVIPVAAMMSRYPSWKVAETRKSGVIMLEWPLVAHFKAPRAGTYRIRSVAHPDHLRGALNLYVDRACAQTVVDAVHQDGSFAFRSIELAAGEHEIALDAGPLYARWSDGTVALWSTPYLEKGLRITNGDVTYAVDYDRMWPDTWSGQEKIHLFSWEGTARVWTLPAAWAARTAVKLFRLTPDGRSDEQRLIVSKGTVAPRLLPRVPYVIVPE